MQARFRLLEVTSTLFHKLVPTHDLMEFEATLVFTTLTYLHHCFLFFSLLSENDANLILSSIYSKSCQSIRQSNFDWTGKRWIFTVNWACKLSSTNHKGLILKHGYPLKLHVVFESWDQRFFVNFILICHVCLLCELTSTYVCIAKFELKKINDLWFENE